MKFTCRVSTKLSSSSKPQILLDTIQRRMKEKDQFMIEGEEMMSCCLTKETHQTAPRLTLDVEYIVMNASHDPMDRADRARLRIVKGSQKTQQVEKRAGGDRSQDRMRTSAGEASSCCNQEQNATDQ